jgi:hypothetical protein
MSIDRRLERLETLAGAPGCSCGGNPVLLIFELPEGERRVPPDGQGSRPIHGPPAGGAFPQPSWGARKEALC